MSFRSITSIFAALKCAYEDCFDGVRDSLPGLFGRQSTASTGSERLLPSPMAGGCPLVPGFLLLGHGVHTGAPTCALETWTDICTEKNLRVKRSTRSPGAGSRKVSSLTSLPQTFIFYWPQSTNPSVSLNLQIINQLQFINSALLKNKM